MDIRIEKGTRQYLNDCEEALLNSELGRKYFTGAGAGKKAVPGEFIGIPIKRNRKNPD